MNAVATGHPEWINTIYALVGPDGEVRYIGRTAQQPAKRMAEHRVAPTRVGAWVRDCSGDVRMIELDLVPSRQWPSRIELEWVAAAREAGCVLFNVLPTRRAA